MTDQNQDEIFKPKQKEKKQFKERFKREEKVAEANKFPSSDDEKNKASRYFQLPKRWVDVTDPFYFNVYRLKTDGLIFILTALVIPFIFLIFAWAFMPVTDTQSLSNRILVIQVGFIGSAIAGFAAFVSRDRKLAFSSGVAFYYLPIFCDFGVGLFSSLFLRNLEETTANYIGLGLQIALTIVWIALILNYVPSIGRRIKKTFTKNWKMLLLVSVLAAAITWAISGPLLGYILQGTVMGETSRNQNILENLKSGGVIPIVFLFIYTVLLAPLYEEIIYRHLIYTGTGNRIAGYFVSALVFAMVHVQMGDLQHIIPYIVAGLLFSGVFNIARGNVTYSWMTHLIYNLIAFILMITL